jgi:hypothetical protein
MRLEILLLGDCLSSYFMRDRERLAETRLKKHKKDILMTIMNLKRKTKVYFSSIMISIILFNLFSCDLNGNNNKYQVIIDDTKPSHYFVFFVLDTPYYSSRILNMTDSNFVFINVNPKDTSPLIYKVLNESKREVSDAMAFNFYSGGFMYKDSIMHQEFYCPGANVDKSKFIRGDDNYDSYFSNQISTKGSSAYYEIRNNWIEKYPNSKASKLFLKKKTIPPTPDYMLRIIDSLNKLERGTY